MKEVTATKRLQINVLSMWSREFQVHLVVGQHGVCIPAQNLPARVIPGDIHPSSACGVLRAGKAWCTGLACMEELESVALGLEGVEWRPQCESSSVCGICTSNGSSAHT